MRYFLFGLCVLMLTSCADKKQPEMLNMSPRSTFSLPVIPSELTSVDERNQFVVENYWLNFNFHDTTQIGRFQMMDQLFTDYVGLLVQVPFITAQKGLKQMMQKAKTDNPMYKCFISLSEKHLYDPNSPIRNEKMYMVVLEDILACKTLDNVSKIRYRHHYDLVMKNRPGEKATDFKFTLITGSQKMLHNIKADYVMIFFNNPDCGDCKNVKQQITTSLVIQRLQQSGMLKILSLYPDKDLTIWYENHSSVPHDWINAYDKGTVIETNELYDLKAIPTLYLLDKDKQVLLKDARFEEIEHYLKTF